MEDLEWFLVYTSIPNWNETAIPKEFKHDSLNQPTNVDPKVNNLMDQLNLKGEFDSLLPKKLLSTSIPKRFFVT